MQSNDIKKGMRMRLNNGWHAVMYDNRKGNIRTAEVQGTYTEIGSVYVWDIAKVLIDNEWIPVDLTDKQKKDRAMVRAMGF